MALSSGEQELQRLVDDLAAAGKALEDARNELVASHASQADVETRLAALNQEATERAEHLTSEIDQARRNSAERELYLEQIQQRVNDLERELSHAAAQLESANQQSSGAEQRIAKLDNELELSARENQTLRRLGQSSVAEAEALAAEVAGLKHGESLFSQSFSFSRLSQSLPSAQSSSKRTPPSRLSSKRPTKRRLATSPKSSPSWRSESAANSRRKNTPASSRPNSSTPAPRRTALRRRIRLASQSSKDCLTRACWTWRKLTKSSSR